MHLSVICRVTKIEPSDKWGHEVTIGVAKKSKIVLHMWDPSDHGFEIGSEVEINIKWK